jgi:hypothetical protein
MFGVLGFALGLNSSRDKKPVDLEALLENGPENVIAEDNPLFDASTGVVENALGPAGGPGVEIAEGIPPV